MDFTVKIYKELLKSLQSTGYTFKTFEQYLKGKEHLYDKKTAVLRHDVDALPESSLLFARIQAEMGISGTYYFRIVPKSWNEEIITEISSMGHEVGYHYENMDTVSLKFKIESLKKDVISNKFKVNEKLLDLAYEDFSENLANLRKQVPVNTICMHGSPRSKYDNKSIWQKYDYKNMDIIGEPYYDLDYDKTFYLTDTGRRWDGWKVSIRDKAPQQEVWINEGLVFHSTQDIVRAVESENFPDKVMFTFHPQRWHIHFMPWAKEFVIQTAKNQIKRILVKINNKK